MNYSAFDILQFHLQHCWPAPPQPSSRLQNAYCPQNDAFVARVYELTASSSAMAGEVKVWVSNKPIQQPWELYTGGGGVNDRKCWCLKINFMTRHNNIIHKHFNDWYLEYKDGLTDGKISRKKGLTNWPKTAFQPCLVLNHATQRDDAKTWTLYLDLPVRYKKSKVLKNEHSIGVRLSSWIWSAN